MKLRLASPVEFPCPFCPFDAARAKFRGTFTVGDPDKGDVAVLHSVPPCPTFIKLDVLPFVQKARRELRRLSVD